MGTFGYRNFQNDSGMDFEEEFKTVPTPTTVRLALLPVVRTVAAGGFIDYHEACMALAAAEVIAASLGRPSVDFPKDLLPLVQNLLLNKDVNTRKMARKAIRAVVKKSELQELWAETADAAHWQAVQKDLLIRLK